jgi:hypothetical protein
LAPASARGRAQGWVAAPAPGVVRRAQAQAEAEERARAEVAAEVAAEAVAALRAA